MIKEKLRYKICCPKCKAKLDLSNDDYTVCTGYRCASRFPIIKDIPILINDSSSIFSVKDYESKGITSSMSTLQSIKYKLQQHIPKPQIGINIKAKTNFMNFKKTLNSDTAYPCILIIGSGEMGKGLEILLNDKSIEFIKTDVILSYRVDTVCDAHDLPFSDKTFDGVIVQAVLEHVCNPCQCVEEIYRVLKPHGLVYAETPFMQQVHMGKYDFTRFTHLGLRRLFRKFEVIDDGAVCGTGMALAWSCRSFMLSFAESNKIRYLITLFAHYLLFWLKYFDYFLIDKPEVLDGASGYYLLGRKSNKVLTDKQLISLYRGNRPDYCVNEINQQM